MILDLFLLKSDNFRFFSNMLSSIIVSSNETSRDTEGDCVIHLTRSEVLAFVCQSSKF